MKKIFKTIISILMWIQITIGFLFFFVFCITVASIFPIEKYNPWMKWLLRLVFKIFWTKVEVEGIENVDLSKKYIYMSNHVSLFDIPLLGGFIPGVVRGIEADRNHKIPIYGQLTRKLGNIPIERGNIHGSVATIRKVVRVIKEDNSKSIIILPEGGRTLTGEMKGFKKLPFFMAKESERELIPIGISGLFTLKRKGSWLIQPTKVKIKFGKPITVEQMKELSSTDLRDYVKVEIGKLIEKH